MLGNKLSSKLDFLFKNQINNTRADFELPWKNIFCVKNNEVFSIRSMQQKYAIC